ncbi:6334_t:CDS:2 [Diversispora eburnea]|uniref:6334_t:CDS:1 n=1 Tax=Diversispora eburnea TaxID=1213867 RepID=A0A9N9GCK7_9GLOM|nr:6334_t:CDS:2 [Diversispora eburnea]
MRERNREKKYRAQEQSPCDKNLGTSNSTDEESHDVKIVNPDSQNFKNSSGSTAIPNDSISDIEMDNDQIVEQELKQQLELHHPLIWQRYDRRIKEIFADGNIKINTAKQQVYQEVKQLLPDISDVSEPVTTPIPSSYISNSSGPDDLTKTKVTIPPTLIKSQSNAPLKLFPLKRKLSKEVRNQVINKLTTHFTDSQKLDKNSSIDTEGEHQTDSYWVLGSHCPLCRENHMSLNEPGIPLDDILKAYSGNSELVQ